MTDNEHEVKAVLDRYQAAFNDNDFETMNALFDEDATFVNFSGALVVGRADLRRAQTFVFSPGGPLADSYVFYTAEYVAVREDVAVVHARQRTAEHPTEARDPMEAIFTTVLVRTPHGWRIRLGQNTPVA